MQAPKCILLSPPRHGSKNTDAWIRIRFWINSSIIFCFHQNAHTHTANVLTDSGAVLEKGVAPGDCLPWQHTITLFLHLWSMKKESHLQVFLNQFPPPTLCLFRASILFHMCILALPGPSSSSSARYVTLRSTALLPNWPILGWDKAMNKVDVAKWSLGDFKWLWKPWATHGEERDTKRYWVEDSRDLDCICKLLITVACVTLAFWKVFKCL